MARPTNQSAYEKLCKELGRVDTERRSILKRMKQTPEFVSKYLVDTLKTFITNNSWFSRANAKNELSYFKLVGFNFSGNKTLAEITKNGASIITIDLEWDYYNYNSVTKEKCVEHTHISVFKDIDNQILNGRKQASSFDEKKLLKAQLTEKKEKLKAELKALEAELKTI